MDPDILLESAGPKPMDCDLSYYLTSNCATTIELTLYEEFDLRIVCPVDSIGECPATSCLARGLFPANPVSGLLVTRNFSRKPSVK